MKKRLLALVLAGIMTLGASMTVFADTITDSATGVDVSGASTVNTPTIKVTVPTSINIALNPFQIAYTFQNDDTDTVYKNQVVSIPVEISSESNVALAVNVSELIAYPTDNDSEAVISSKPVAGGKVTTKSVYLYLEVVKGAAATAKFSGAGLVPASTKTVTEGTKQDAVITLDAGTDAAPSKATFKVGGDMVANPVDTDGNSDPWTSDDKVTISFKFTFTPQLGSLK